MLVKPCLKRAAVFVFSLCLCSWSASVHAGDLKVSDAFARVTPSGSGGAFMVIHNHTMESDRLLAVGTSIARRAELHETQDDNGVMRMQQIESIEVAPHGMVALEPGGLHVMMFGIEEKVKPGERILLTLEFETAGQIEVEAEVVGLGQGHQQGKHKHGSHNEGLTINVKRISTEGVGESIGTIGIVGLHHGIKLQPQLSGLTPGPHAFHIHENPDCGPGEKSGHMVAGLAAGGHYDPDNAGHDHSQGHGHGNKPAGDLPELTVDADGKASQAVEVHSLTFEQVIGRSIMIHAHGEMLEDPAKAKGGGARIACGVITQ